MITERFRKTALTMRETRFVDVLAFVVTLAVVVVIVGGGVTLADWIDDRPHTVWPQLVAAFERLTP